MIKKSLKIKPAKKISHAKQDGFERGLLPTPPPPPPKKKNEGEGGRGSSNIRKNHGNIHAPPSLGSIFLPLHSCLPCHYLQDAVHPVPNFHLRAPLPPHPASCSIAKLSNEWCIPSKQQRRHNFHVYTGFRDSQGSGGRGGKIIFFDVPFPFRPLKIRSKVFFPVVLE